VSENIVTQELLYKAVCVPPLDNERTANYCRTAAPLLILAADRRYRAAQRKLKFLYLHMKMFNG